MGGVGRVVKCYLSDKYWSTPLMRMILEELATALEIVNHFVGNPVGRTTGMGGEGSR